MAWADLDKLAVAKRDGATTLVVRDDRSYDRMLETRHLSLIVAIARVVRGRHALAEKYGGRGSVVYLTSYSPPEALVDAVTAAGGVVFDGKREHTARSPMATTMQLDEAFSDLASAIRRRLGAKSFGAALDTLEWEVRRKPPERGSDAWWIAIIELAALTGECLREERAARWVEAPAERLPLALDLGKSKLLFPGKLAQAIVEGGEGTMRALLEATRPQVTPIGGAPVMPLLCNRRAVPIEQLTWEPLLAAEFDKDTLPVIVYVEDQGGTIKWPLDGGPPKPELVARAHSNLAKEPVELEVIDIPGAIDSHKLVVVTGGFYAAESLLVPATMARVASLLGGAEMLVAGVPARGQLLVIDAARAVLDEQLSQSFLLVVEKHYLEAPERDRISTEGFVCIKNRPVGLVQSNLMDMRRVLRDAGVDLD